MNETTLLRKGMETLITTLGNVEAERFVSILLRDSFDYTEWRRDNLFVGMSVEEISREAMKVHRQFKK
ncbi:MAG: hypothetical protein LBT05_13035 [Planctomycetaceae bacterium]|jgi:hypothetical protein|nr:hypothetical protein [Planctomycetaceae bacterium]